MSLTPNQKRCALADTKAYIEKTWPDDAPIPYFSANDGSDKLSEWVNGLLNHLEAKNSIIANFYRTQSDQGEGDVLTLLKDVGKRLRHKRKRKFVRPSND